MKKKASYISNFSLIRPAFKISQLDAFNWIAAAHAKADSISNSSAEEQSKQQFLERLNHVGCKDPLIMSRGHSIEDFLHKDWEKMDVYRLHESPSGISIKGRLSIHQKIVDGMFERFYTSESELPDDLIHVTCTGYASPSGGQKIVSKLGQKNKTTVTHVYHMGCYGSIPAVRIAAAYCAETDRRADVVHTEVCTLHMNPSIHSADQLVVQSLFADGFIKYSIQSMDVPLQPSFKILAIHEQIIPNSLNAMQWLVADWGFQFVLAREIPVLITKSVLNYVKELCQKANIPFDQMIKEGIFAIHPGGPKIVHYIQEILGLRDEQVAASYDVLQKYGNMSSATLPHIWNSLCGQLKKETKILSIAFGPGLNIAGLIMESA